MSPCGCTATLSEQFDEAYVAAKVERRRKKGPEKTALELAEALASLRSANGGLEGTSALDVGAGFGDVLLELFPRGLRAAFHVEASPAYSGAARDFAREAGFEDRVRFMVGDAVALAGGDAPPGNGLDGSDGTTGLPTADIVVLDRVVCCYPDMETLLDVTSARARDLYALSAPRSLLPVRAVIWLENLGRLLGKNPFRTFVHAWSAMDRRLAERGFARAWEGGTLVWRIAVYRRNRGAGERSATAPDRASSPTELGPAAVRG